MRLSTGAASLATVLIAGTASLAGAQDAFEEEKTVPAAGDELATPASPASSPASSGAEATKGSPDAAAPTPPAEASGPGKVRLYAGTRFGFGGDLESEPKNGGPTLDSDAKTTIGIQFGGDYVMNDYFALGGELRLGWFNSKSLDNSGIDRSLLVDLVVKPRGRYMLSSLPLEVYGTIPLGVTAPAMDDTAPEDGKLGANVGIGGGATYFFSNKLGVTLDTEWLMHWFRTNTKAGDIKIKNRLGQLTFFANAVFAF